MPDILQALYLPGAKSRQRHLIMPVLLPLLRDADEYREPFVGSGVIGLAVMAQCPQLSFWINDRDAALTCLWWSLRHRGPEIVKLIEAFEPNPDAFDKFHAELDALANCPDDPTEIIRTGFMKFVLHQTSHSGYGSGVRGGKQYVNTKITERWQVDRITKKILIIANRLRRCDVRITGYDWSRLMNECIKDAQRSRVFFYFDPPFLMDNPEWQQHYYRHSFSDDDHIRLAEALQELRHTWALSLGDHHRVWQLYRWARIRPIGTRNLLITRE